MERFRIHVPDEVLDDLRRRIAATRWPAEVFRADRPGAAGRPGRQGEDWTHGTDPGVLRDLLEYWEREYDWREAERRLNAQPHYTAAVGGSTLHFVHWRGAGPDPFPLVLSHGWPSSFLELEPLARLLSQPEDPADAFDVVVPSLPGYGFSDPPAPGEALPAVTAGRLATLMREVLGYPRFGAVGVDIGAEVTTRLGMDHADGVVGIHVDPDGVREPAGRDGASLVPALSPAERSYVEARAAWVAEHGGYGHLQGTRPRTLAFGLTDSPAGLAAYLVEKYRAWSDGDGDVLRRFSRDDLLTTLTLYWATGTIGSSFLPYYDERHQPAAPVRVGVPVAVALWREPDLPLPPREYAERSLNVTRWTPMPRGGHFAPSEEPELLAEDVRAFFRPLRDPALSAARTGLGGGD